MTTNILNIKIVKDALEKRFFDKWATEYSGTISCVANDTITSPLIDNTFDGFNSKYITTKSGFIENNDYEFKIKEFDLLSDPNVITTEIVYGSEIITEIGNGDEIIIGYPSAVQMWKKWRVGGLGIEEPYIKLQLLGGKKTFFENVGNEKLRYLMPEIFQIDIYAPDQYLDVDDFFAEQRCLISDIFQDILIVQSIETILPHSLWTQAWTNAGDVKEWEVPVNGWYRLTITFVVNWIS